MISDDLFYALIALGMSFLLWGFDKIIEFVPKKYSRYFKYVVGAAYFIIGLAIVELALKAHSQ